MGLSQKKEEKKLPIFSASKIYMVISTVRKNKNMFTIFLLYDFAIAICLLSC